MITQGILPYQYQEEKSTGGMTALGGLPAYLDLAVAMGLPRMIDKEIGVRAGEQGWLDRQVVMSLIMLNLAGGECVEDLRVMEKDEGFSRILRRVEMHDVPRKERREMEGRFRKERERAVPSPSAVFRYLGAFHDGQEEQKRVPHAAFIPSPNEHLRGLGRVNAGILAFDQAHAPEETATLDMDATLIETHKREALRGYEGYRAYQPLDVYWHEKDMVVRSEFRDGNVPAGYENLRVLKEALGYLPRGVKKARFRSDSAAYQKDILQYCAEGKDERFGVIEFAVSADVTPEFKSAAAEAEKWKPLRRRVNGELVETDREWAEVCFVPSWIGRKKGGAEYRYLAVREPLRQLELPALPRQEEFSFPVMEFGDGRRYKVFGLVSNRVDMDGEELIWWSRERCGRSEAAHSAMKEDLAGGVLPSGDFGENAAWWGITILAYNLNSVMKRRALGGEWAGRRMKAIRFSLIGLPGRVVEHARGLVIKICAGHPGIAALIEARHRILAMSGAPPG